MSHADSPYAWWSRAARAVLVCGGNNWDTEQPDTRCWRWDPCGDTWVQELELPAGGPQLAAVPPPKAVSRSVLYCTILYCPGLYGGVSGQALVAGREELWLVGGGNGSAGGETWVSVLNCIVCRCRVYSAGAGLGGGHLEPGAGPRAAAATLRPLRRHAGRPGGGGGRARRGGSRGHGGGGDTILYSAVECESWVQVLDTATRTVRTEQGWTMPSRR